MAPQYKNSPKHQQFMENVSACFRSGRWNLEHIEYLNENRLKYHLSHEDIGLFLMQHYQYTYTMAMEDGVINELENQNLIQIKSLYNHLNPPKNRYEIQNIKNKINHLTRRYEVTNGVQEQMHINEENIDFVEQKEEAEFNAKYNLQEEVKNTYHKRNIRYPVPKLTPYRNYGY